MKRSGQIIVAAGSAAVAGLLFWIFRTEPSAEPKAPEIPQIKPISSTVVQTPVSPPPGPAANKPAVAETPPAVHAEKVEGAKRPYVRLTVKPGQPIPELFPHQEERDKLIKLATTYDPQSIPLIVPYLTHEEATVRQTARQALIQLGRPEALPYLKEAARKAKDRAEAQELQEIIEFLSLARTSDVMDPAEMPPAEAPSKS